VGDGPERAALEKIAGAQVKFLGTQPHAVIREQLAGARALLFPGLEDFGIVPVEAQAVGCPVIAFGEGGVLDTVRNGETGILFREQSTAALVKAMQEADLLEFDPCALRENALQFSTEHFNSRLLGFIKAKTK
jgi:glycosyltransferase involved in cell wall biosynthesis